MHALADKLKPAGTSYSAETWHLYCASRFLGCEDVRLPDGKVIPVPFRTSELDVTEFTNLMTATEAWAAENDVYLDEIPNAA